MVFIKFLGIIDTLLAVIFFIDAFFHIAALTPLIIFLALILLIKGLIFLCSYDPASGIDVISGVDVIIAFVIIYAMQFTVFPFIVVIIALFLLQKGIASLMS